MMLISRSGMCSFNDAREPGPEIVSIKRGKMDDGGRSL